MLKRVRSYRAVVLGLVLASLLATLATASAQAPPSAARRPDPGRLSVTGIDLVEWSPSKRVEKRFLLDFAADLGLTPDNLEGLAFGPRMADGRYPLIDVRDNNFSPVQFTQVVLLVIKLDRVPSSS